MSELRSREGVTARALEFAILTAARTNEVIGARWAEIDLDAATWTIPAARMKMAKEHRVPLTEPAVELLRGLYTEANNDLVFIGAQAGRGLGDRALAEVLERMERTDITVHGFRSTFRDWAAEVSHYPNHVVEMALAHAISNTVERAYRRGDLFEKRRASDARVGDILLQGGTMKKPRWDCRNDEDRRLLENWTLDQLDKLDHEHVTERDIEAMQSDEFFKWSEEQFRRQQQRVRIVKAAKAKDTRLLTRLTTNDPELQQLAVRVLTLSAGAVGRKAVGKLILWGKSEVFLNALQSTFIASMIFGKTNSDIAIARHVQPQSRLLLDVGGSKSVSSGSFARI